MAQLRELDRRVLDAAVSFVDKVRPEHLSWPTPCAGWSLEVLLRHMVGNNHGFAEAARGAAAQRGVWEEATLGDDPVAAFRASATDVTTAFADETISDRKLEVYGYGAYSAATVLSMHVLDFLVHGWDVARSIGDPGVLDEELAEAVLRIALRFPYNRPDKAFDLKVEVPDDAPAHHRLVAYVGRSPHWPD